MALLFGDLD